MNRWVVETKAQTMDNEVLTVIQIYETGINKEGTKQGLISKKRKVLIYDGQKYDFKC